ncbi:hypothetical protein TanjilG_00056 [Lupinus angustifolius]|uniref:serine-arginine protein 55-like n=1 Tax=Lupinus angustifolius TaxID=3871 RepID=UPI00090DBB63|nr:PREDICTED: serine-arginine protein 55-like [Lupinus angustifolius]OIV90412.1 hypothetical protein TanjilG_00056 [Lupinus angustifolius]
MSLFIGNLSKHTRRDELERVFRMFGHCNVQLKGGGYGFVVFDIAADAAKALRELKGETICGNRLNLSWSSKQPTRNFQTLGRGGRKSQHARNSDRSYGTRKVGFSGGRNREMDNVGRIESFDVRGKERDHRHDDIKDCVGEQKDHEVLPNEGDGAVPTLRDKVKIQNALEFDRYESYSVYDRKHDNEDYHVGHGSGSHGANVQKNMKRAQGGQDNSVEVENKSGPGSCVKLQSSGDALLLRQHRNERSISGSRQLHAPLRNESSPLTKETDRPQGKEYGGMKRSRNEIESPQGSQVKISKQLSSCSLPSDASHSLSNSLSSKSMPRSSYRDGLRSVSSRGCSSSSKVRSSKSQGRGKSLNSRRSNSQASLSASLNQPLQSPSKTHLNSNSVPITALESEDHLVAKGQHMGSALEVENIQSKDTGIAVNGNVARYTTKMEDAMEKDQDIQQDNSGNHILLNPSDGVTNLTKPFVGGDLSPGLVKETEGFLHSGALLMDDLPTEIQKPASETHVNCHSGLSTFISSEEMSMVLENCGLDFPKVDEQDLTVDAFFGSARLWPWHIVYYRRLKKGLISTENYARRVAQNQEFGIVDKYIRSSSGWGELRLENS